VPLLTAIEEQVRLEGILDRHGVEDPDVEARVDAMSCPRRLWRIGILSIRAGRWQAGGKPKRSQRLQSRITQLPEDGECRLPVIPCPLRFAPCQRRRGSMSKSRCLSMKVFQVARQNPCDLEHLLGVGMPAEPTQDLAEVQVESASEALHLVAVVVEGPADLQGLPQMFRSQLGLPRCQEATAQAPQDHGPSEAWRRPQPLHRSQDARSEPRQVTVISRLRAQDGSPLVVPGGFGGRLALRDVGKEAMKLPHLFACRIELPRQRQGLHRELPGFSQPPGLTAPEAGETGHAVQQWNKAALLQPGLDRPAIAAFGRACITGVFLDLPERCPRLRRCRQVTGCHSQARRFEVVPLRLVRLAGVLQDGSELVPGE
jgi:hypothetical protein